MTAITGPAIPRYRLLVLRAGIKLEIGGMSHSQGRWFATKQALRELNLDWVEPQPRMTRKRAEAILRKLEEHINQLDAPHPQPSCSNCGSQELDPRGECYTCAIQLPTTQ